MENFWQEFAKLLGVFAVIAGAASWLIKSIVTYFLSKDTENYKSRLTKDVEDFKNQLTKETTRETENLKSQLQITAKEREIQFSKLHEKRAEIICDFYQLIYEADKSIRALEYRVKNNNDEGMLEKSAQEAHEACIAALDFFEKHKLYLSKDLSDKIHRILSTMELTSLSYNYSDSLLRSNGLEIYTKQKEKIATIMEGLEQEFRIMLGSESEKTGELTKIN